MNRSWWSGGCEWFRWPGAKVLAEAKTPEELAGACQRLDRRVSVILFVFLTVPLALGWYWVLSHIASLVADRFLGARFQLQAVVYFWLVPAMPLGILTLGLFESPFRRWFLGDHDETYRRSVGSVSRRVETLSYLAVGGGMCVVVIMMLHWRATFGDDRIVIYPLFSMSSRSYSYADVVRIEQGDFLRAPSGQVKANSDRDFTILFSDGYKWSAYCMSEETGWDGRERALQFVAARSGKAILRRRIQGN